MDRQDDEDMIALSHGDIPPEIGEDTRGRRGDKTNLVKVVRQCAIMVLCACDDYLGWDRTIRTKRRST